MSIYFPPRRSLKQSLLLFLTMMIIATGASLHVPDASAEEDPFAPHGYQLLLNGLSHDDESGTSVALAGDTLFIGVPNKKGRVEVLRKNQFGQWASSQTLQPPANSGVEEQLGWAMATNGSLIAISGKSDDWSVQYQSPIWVYRRSSSGSFVPAQVIDVAPSNSQGLRAGNFGYSLAMDGDYLAVGAPDTPYYAATGLQARGGSVYIYRYNQQQGTFTLIKQLVPPIFNSDMRFGMAVDLQDDTLVVGARGDLTNFGYTFVFRNNPAANDWVHEATLTASDASNQSRFGDAVSLDGTVLAIGAPYNYHIEPNGQEYPGNGAVYLFSYNSVLGTWSEANKIVNLQNEAMGLKMFGRTVDYRDNTLLISAPRVKPQKSPWYTGTVYLYQCNATLQCNIETELYPFDAVQNDEYFGFSLAVGDSEIIIGSPTASRGGGLTGTTYAFSRPRLAWVWAHQPGTAQYSPSGAEYVYSSVGDTVTITRTAVGRYTVNFGKVMDGVRGTVLVTQYDTDNDGTCSLHYWSGSNVYVRCYNRNGVLVDSEFRAMFYGVWGFHLGSGISIQRRESYLWNNLTNSNGIPNEGYQMSAVGAQYQVTYRGTGQYTVKVPGVWKSGESPHALVTPYGDQPRYCQTASWTLYPDYANLYVNCYDMQGTARDASFTLQFFSQYLPSQHGAFLRNFSPSSAAYTPTGGYQWNSTGGTSYIERVSQGSYWVHLPGLASAGGMAQANNYSYTNNRCHAEGMWNQGSEKIVAVRCQTPTGAPVDNKFSLLYLQNPAATAIN